jgi:hypothetical protein
MSLSNTKPDAANDDLETAAPADVLSWRSPAERNRKLKFWRQAVMIAFGEQTRVLRIAWTLDALFNAKTGYAHPGNTYLARATGIAVNKVQEALAALEEGGAIVRRVTVQRGSQRWRAIYPAATLLGGVTPTVGVTGHPRLPGVQTLKRYLPRSQLDYARLAHAKRDGQPAPAEPPPDIAEPSQRQDRPPTLRLTRGSGTRLKEKMAVRAGDGLGAEPPPQDRASGDALLATVPLLLEASRLLSRQPAAATGTEAPRTAMQPGHDNTPLP